MTTNSASGARHTVPSKFLATVEHPGVVVDQQNALKSLGGTIALQNTFVQGASEKALGLQLRPKDPYRRPLSAQEVATNNVVLKITVPKRTGRRRKKGTKDDFVHPELGDQKFEPISTASLLHRMNNPSQDYKVKAVGSTGETYRFRALPDFQYSLMSSRMARDFENQVLSCDVEALRSFDLSHGRKHPPQTIDMIPPPVFDTAPYPHTYGYNQNPAVKNVVNPDGKLTTINTQNPKPAGASGAPFDIQQVPQEPDPKLPPVSGLDGNVKRCLEKAEMLLEERPIFTRRAFMNLLGKEFHYAFRYALPYCVYTFMSGPWRDALIKYGVDPRQHSEMWKYQTLTIKLLGRADHSHGTAIPAWRQGRTEVIGGTYATSHLFDGKNIFRDGSTWQICDITDPQIVELSKGMPMRDTCDDMNWGWLYPISLCKIHVVMRDKTRFLLNNSIPNENDYDFLNEVPNNTAAFHEFLRKTKILDPRKKRIATNIRALSDETKAIHRGDGGRSQKPRQDHPAEDDAGADEGVSEVDDEDVEDEGDDEEDDDLENAEE